MRDRLMGGLLSWAGYDLSPDNPRDWPPEKKIELITAMGFSPQGDTHHVDCPQRVDSGYLCNCVPDATVWAQPKDVNEFRHETWEERRAAAIKRQEGQR